jgi:hypothetical protein
MRTCGCTGFTCGLDCPQRPDRPLMTGQPGAVLTPDDVILAGCELDLEDSWRVRRNSVSAILDRSPEWDHGPFSD